MAASTTPTSDALATVAFLTGVSDAGTLNATSYWAWDESVTSRTVYDGSQWAHKWAGGAAGSFGGTVTYAFDPGSAFTGAEQGIIVAGLALWSAVADIRFAPAAGFNSADLAFDKPGSTDVSGLSGGSYTDDASGDGTPGSPVVPTITGATVVFDTGASYWSQLASFTAYGGYGVDTVVHELGHVLGLGHSGPYNDTVNPFTQQFDSTDSRLWSVMSYIDPDAPSRYSNAYAYPDAAWGRGVDGSAREPTTWMPLDILAAQRLYGAPTSTPLSGGQVFGFHTNVDPAIRAFFDFTVNTAPVVTLWDAGGGNTLDLSGFAQAASVDLNPGRFSSAGGLVDNIGIAYDTAIDRVVGGPGGLTATVNANADTIQATGGFNAAVFAAPGQIYRVAPGAVAGVTTVLSGTGIVDTLLGVQDVRFSGGDIISADAAQVELSGGGNQLYLGDLFARVSSAGADTMLAGAGGAAITVNGTVGALIFGTSGPLGVVDGGGADTVVTGTGGATVQGGAGSQLIWAASALSFSGGLGSATVAAVTASVTVRAGPGGGVFVGGSAGHNVLAALGNQATMFGGGSGDELVVANAGTNVLAAGAGAETLFGGGAQGDNAFWTGTGADVMVGGLGTNTYVAGSGAAQVLAGGASNLLVVFDGSAGGQMDVAGWNPAHDRIALLGFAPDAEAQALASASLGAGATTITLADDTRITFAGVTGITSAWFS